MRRLELEVLLSLAEVSIKEENGPLNSGVVAYFCSVLDSVHAHITGWITAECFITKFFPTQSSSTFDPQILVEFPTDVIAIGLLEV